jgi:PGF-CTERM protein
MVLSVFAMSASFAGAAAAQADDVEVNPDVVDLADEDTEIDVTVSHGEDDEQVAIAIADEDDEVVHSEESATDDGESTTLSVDVSALAEGEYTVYAEAGAEADVAAPDEGDDIGDFGDVDAEATLTITDDEEETHELTVNVDGLEDDDAATVTVSDEDGEVASQENVTDSAVFDLEDGDYTIEASAEGYAADSAEVTIDGAAETETLELGDFGVESSTVFQGEDLTATVPSDADVELRSGEAGDSSFEQQLTNDDGVIDIDTSGLEGDYVIRIDGEDSEDHEFEVAVQTLDAEFDEERVLNEGDNTEAELELDSNRIGYDVEVTADGLSSSELESIFGDSVEEATDDGVILASDDTSADFDGIDAGEYEFTIEVTDTDAEAEATIEVAEFGDAIASFDESVYQEHAGDIAEFTVKLSNTDSANVVIEEEDTNYEAELEVEDVDEDDEVTVYFNTYLAGSGDEGAENGDVFYTDEDSDDIVTLVHEDTEAFEWEDGERLLPASLNMELYVDGDSETGDRVDLATLILKQGSLDDAATGVAPKDADLDTVEDITDAVTKTDEVAEEDQLIFAFEASGIFGHLDAEQFDGHFNLLIEQTNNQYDDGEYLGERADYDLVQDPENDRFFVVVETNPELDVEAGDEYMVTFEVDEDYPYFDEDDEKKKDFGTSVSTEFTVVERSVEFIGLDKEDTLRVAISDEAKISGEATAAPGTDIRVQIEATGDSPFLMHDTVEVDSDGEFTATFDTSDQNVDQEFTATAIDLLASDNVSTTVDAIFIDDEKKDKEEDEKKDDDAKEDDGLEDDDAMDDDAIVGDDVTDDDAADDDDEPGAPSDDQPGFGIAVALLALLAAAGFALRRQ